MTLLHLAYQAGADQLAAKSFDYSPSSVRDRWAAGQRDMKAGLAALENRAGDGSRFSYVTIDETHPLSGVPQAEEPTIGRQEP